MAEESGSNPKKDREQASTSQYPYGQNTGRLNLLLVEDNIADVLMVREAVACHGLPIDVYHASDGAQAIKFLFPAESDPPSPMPHLALLDLNIPKIDGFEVLRRIRGSERYAGLPVVIVTSSDSPSDRSEAAKQADGYFQKPADYAGFLKLGDYLRIILTDRKLL